MTPPNSNTLTSPVSIVLCDPHAQSLELWLPQPIEHDPAASELWIESLDHQTRQAVGPLTMIGTDRLRFQWPEALPRQWWDVNAPALYRITGQLRQLGHNNHTVPIDINFGLRWWSTDDEQITLNGQPFYVRGFIRGIIAHDHPNLTGLSDEQADEKNIRAAKSFGFNFVRWHSTVPSESYLNAADRLGLAVQVELGFEYHQGEFRFDHEQWEQTIRRVSRHPSVAIYCLGNEIREAGKYPEIQALIERARQWDASPLVMDNCGWGQPDRPGPDVYSQHVSYFFPYGEHTDMFDRIQGFDLEGFCQTPPPAPGEPGSVEKPLRPVMAHEVCHYIAMRDLDQLERKWEKWKQESDFDIDADPDHPAANLPVWVERLRKLYRAKGLEQDEPQLRHASEQFQELAHRHVLESIRLSPALRGYQMLQFSNCWKFENSNGLVDAFDDPIHWQADDFARFNADTVLLARLGHERSFAAGSSLRVPAYLSHFGKHAMTDATLHATLTAQGRSLAQVQLGPFKSLEIGQLHELGEVALDIPAAIDSTLGQLTLTLESESGTIENHWHVWLLSGKNKPKTSPATADPRIVRELTPNVITDIAAGEHRLHLYKPDYLFDPEQPRPALDFAGRRELMKAVIWDRGDNLGAIVRDHPALSQLPHEGVADWQFAPLFHHGAKINLDDFPVQIDPIVQGVDRPIRDRMEVKKMGKKDFDPTHTCRRWGWLFELAIGENGGRLLVCGLNVDAPSLVGSHVLDQLLRYLDDPNGTPSAHVDPNTLTTYMKEQGQAQPHQEPPMTEYWLRDRDPVETILFWQELGITLR